MRNIIKASLTLVLIIDNTCVLSMDQGLSKSASVSGKIHITLRKSAMIQISQPPDITLRALDPSAPYSLIGTSNICILNHGADYVVTAISSHSGSSGASGNDNSIRFRLNNGGTSHADFIRYDVQWNNINTENTNHRNSQDRHTLQNARVFMPRRPARHCDTATKGFSLGNVRTAIKSHHADFKAANQGNYSDVLTLIIATR